MRADLQLITKLVPERSDVLDLGCGDGELLAYLMHHKGVKGYGIEIDSANIQCCIERRVNVIEQNLNQGLSNFQTKSVDVVVMSQALHEVRYPDQLLDEMLRVGRYSIVTFPNFGYWRCRWDLFSKGQMPITKTLPYAWYNTPNIHLCTIEDFENHCREQSIDIRQRYILDHHNQRNEWMNRMPNLFGVSAIYQISRAASS